VCLPESQGGRRPDAARRTTPPPLCPP
jgi:hypothetical protein